MQLSNQQQRAAEMITEWFEGSLDPYFYLAGYAGTGKSTIVNALVERLNIRKVAYCAFTGKAASILAAKGNTPSSTVHSLIYDPMEDPKNPKNIIFSLKGTIPSFDLIVLDECSMVSKELFEDLLSFDIPILILGDPGQLPPVKGEAAFGEPEITLTEVHRQAKDSNILKAATDAREDKPLLDYDFEDCKILKACPFKKDKMKLFLSVFDKENPQQVICGLNKTRQILNRLIRRHLFGTDVSNFPLKGEKVICLRNDKERGLFNGGIYTCVTHDYIDGKYENRPYNQVRYGTMVMQDDEGRYIELQVDFRSFKACMDNDKIPMNTKADGHPFDYAHVITCHKSQGSQWDDVIVFDESRFFKDLKKNWLYTAITRTAKKLWIIK